MYKWLGGDFENQIKIITFAISLTEAEPETKQDFKKLSASKFSLANSWLKTTLRLLTSRLLTSIQIKNQYINQYIIYGRDNKLKSIIKEPVWEPRAVSTTPVS